MLGVIAYLHDSVECMHWPSQYGWTVVHFAAHNGHLEMLQELLERFNCEADKRDKKVCLLKWFGVSITTSTCMHSLYHNDIRQYVRQHTHSMYIACSLSSSSSIPLCVLLLMLVISRLCSI